MQHQVSSSFTVILKFFLPCVWITLFATFALGAFLSKEPMLGGIPIQQFRIGTLVFLFFGVGLLYWAVMRLKRVEMDHQFVYITNYRTYVRYPLPSIEKITQSDWLVFKTVHLQLKEKGIFGQKISFVASKRKLDDFLRTHPQVARRFMD